MVEVVVVQDELEVVVQYLELPMLINGLNLNLILSELYSRQLIHGDLGGGPGCIGGGG